MSFRSMFATDTDLESKGVKVEYGDIWVRIARAGGANKRYTKMITQMMRPYQRQIETKTLGEEKARKVLIEVYAKTVVLDWGGPVEFADGTQAGAYTIEKGMRVMKEFPEFYAEIGRMSNELSLFKEIDLEEEAENSETP